MKNKICDRSVMTQTVSEEYFCRCVILEIHDNVPNSESAMLQHISTFLVYFSVVIASSRAH